jgi:hypothetical protein
LLFPGHAEESMLVLSLTISRCVSYDAKIASVTALVWAASADLAVVVKGKRACLLGQVYSITSQNQHAFVDSYSLSVLMGVAWVSCNA